MCDQSESTPADKGRDAIQHYADFLSNNSPDSNETIRVVLSKNDSNKPSSVRYTGPEGSFKIKVDPQKQQITADVKFTTGNFKATVTSDKSETKGIEPVFHKHWGKFHEVFNPTN